MGSRLFGNWSHGAQPGINSPVLRLLQSTLGFGVVQTCQAIAEKVSTMRRFIIAICIMSLCENFPNVLL